MKNNIHQSIAISNMERKEQSNMHSVDLKIFIMKNSWMHYQMSSFNFLICSKEQWRFQMNEFLRDAFKVLLMTKW